MQSENFPKNILVVDNDRVRNLKLSILIKRFDYNVFVAANSQDFMRMVKGILPQLVLMDLRMPLIDGKTCLEWLRSNKGLDIIHVVVMGEVQDMDLLDGSLKKGANAKIVRPISPTRLYQVIEDLMQTTKRKVPRLRVIFRATISTEKERRGTFAISISENGVFIRTMNPLERGISLRLSLDLPSAKPIELDGEVIYGVQYNSEKFIEPGMGIRFVNIPEKIRAGIRKFVEEQLMSDLDPNMLL
jgi:CheY-like chemotaxis protein